jgi:ubiquinol-cytochrome c reductase iron-sulfur subunit
MTERRPLAGRRPLARREVLGGVAAVIAVTCVHTSQSSTPEDVRVAQFGVPIDIQDIEPGHWRHVEIDGSPIFIRRLTRSQIEAAESSSASHATDPRDEWIIVSGLCTHAGCRVAAGLGAYDGWICFCHGSEYDTYGRVRRGPAQRDLPAVPHVIRDGRLILLSAAQERGR